MQITHEEARKLIQLHSDSALNANKQNMLSGHLKECAECRVYANQLEETENILRGLLGRQWKVTPSPLSIYALLEKRRRSEKATILLTTRTAMISLLVMVFLFGVWQLTWTAIEAPRQTPLGIFPVPTPSTQLTSTNITTPDCEQIRYKVQEGDTLDSVADQFSTSKKMIMIINEMKTEFINSTMELAIPLCSFTPTGTIYPPTSTITLTPRNSFTSYTPGR